MTSKLIRHVFAATDLSPPSLHAVDRGFEVAHTAGANYSVMSALGLDALGPLRKLLGGDAESVGAKLVEKQHAALDAIVAEPNRNKGVAAKVLVEQGLARTVVAAYAATTDADLLVVGARGQSAVRRLLIGSTASHLLRKSRCPVLIVKTPGAAPYRRVLVAADFSPASLLALRLTRELAPTADIELLHVFDVPFEGMLSYAGVGEDVIHRYRVEAREKALGELHALARSAGLEEGRYTTHVEHGEAGRAIVAHAQARQSDLVVMGKHGTHVSEELLLGSVTKRVLEEVTVDLLVVVDQRKTHRSH